MILFAVKVSHISPSHDKTGRPSGPADSPAFLLAQLGAHAAMKFGERLGGLALSPPHAGILRFVGMSGGISQQALARQLRILPSRLVALLDELEERKLVERRADATDRRSYALHLTDQGRETMKAIGRIAREHQEALLSALTVDERAHLQALLQRVAAEQGLSHGVHPGFQRLKPKGGAGKP